MISVAIDGPAGAGKSTIARQVAARLGATYIDTGAMYRALTLKALEHNCSVEDEEALVELLENSKIELKQVDGRQEVYLDGHNVTEEIRSPLVSRHVSSVAKHPRVRSIMVQLQRDLARRTSVVMDGRDIGTKVLPDATVKIYLTASVEERARRRYHELREKGYPADFGRIKEEIQLRDRMDSERAASPLRKAPDAVEIDTTELSVDEVVERILHILTRVKLS